MAPSSPSATSPQKASRKSVSNDVSTILYLFYLQKKKHRMCEHDLFLMTKRGKNEREETTSIFIVIFPCGIKEMNPTDLGRAPNWNDTLLPQNDEGLMQRRIIADSVGLLQRRFDDHGRYTYQKTKRLCDKSGTWEFLLLTNEGKSFQVKNYERKNIGYRRKKKGKSTTTKHGSCTSSVLFLQVQRCKRLHNIHYLPHSFDADEYFAHLFVANFRNVERKPSP